MIKMAVYNAYLLCKKLGGTRNQIWFRTNVIEYTHAGKPKSTINGLQAPQGFEPIETQWQALSQNYRVARPKAGKS